MDEHGLERLEMTPELADEFTRRTLEASWDGVIVQKVTPQRKAELLEAMRPLLIAPWR